MYAGYLIEYTKMETETLHIRNYFGALINAFSDRGNQILPLIFVVKNVKL